MSPSDRPVASVILAHPYPKSLNHALFDAVVRSLAGSGTDVRPHDLYAEGFNPVLSVGELGKKPTDDPLVALYAKELLESSLLVFIHPNWWGQPPAIMKGYVDRVFRPPYAYDFDPDRQDLPARGMLAGKSALVLNTSNTEAEREEGYFHDPLEWEWIRCVFGFCGISRSRRRMFRIVASSTPDERAAWLAEAGELARACLDGSAFD